MNSTIRQTCVQSLTAFLAAHPAESRKAVLGGAYALLAESKKIPALKMPLMRSYLGTVLNDLVASGDVKKDANGAYSLKKEALIIVEESRIAARILQMLSSKSMTKEAIFRSLQKHFKTTETPSLKDDNVLRSTAGSVLSRCVEAGTITLAGGSYSLRPAPLQKISEPLDENAFKPVFLARLHEMGGPFFERFMANLLEKYYLMTGRNVIYCEVSGGSTDGGIDVIIDTEDELGFTEHILMQTKCRRTAHTTEKDVREFYGAMHAQSGSRGIYATTATFHPGAQAFLDSLDNCIGIDGDKLFELVKKTAYGIHKTKRGLTFDETIFGK